MLDFDTTTCVASNSTRLATGSLPRDMAISPGGDTVYVAGAFDALAPNPPTNVAFPTITGTPAVGSTLTAGPGAWSSYVPPTLAYHWLRCKTSTCSAISGAAEETHVVGAEDRGFQLEVQVTATNPGGQAFAVSSRTAYVPQIAPPLGGGVASVTINAAAVFTRSPSVVLTIRAPSSATAVRISNDGGFAGATTKTLDDAVTQHHWTLASSGSERLPKTVYVRFVGAGFDQNQTLTDDIILDETPPTITTVSATAATARPAPRAYRRTVTVKIKARDLTSGVSKIQLTTNRSQAGREACISDSPHHPHRRQDALGPGPRPCRQSLSLEAGRNPHRQARLRAACGGPRAPRRSLVRGDDPAPLASKASAAELQLRAHHPQLLLELAFDLDEHVLGGAVERTEPVHPGAGALGGFGEAAGELAQHGVVLDRAPGDLPQLLAGGDRVGLTVGELADRDGALGDHVGQLAPRVDQHVDLEVHVRNRGPTTLQCSCLPTAPGRSGRPAWPAA
jgi:hypothetical protein